jgi:hypothetical protein
MRRGLLLAPLLAAAVLGLAGCGTAADGTTVPTTLAAPPQTAKLDWVEPFPATSPALVFGVASFAVTEYGWSADISIDNRSDVGWKIVDRNDQTALDFGLLLFPNNDQDEFQHKVNTFDVPATRPATSYKPALPVVLEQGATWRGTISAPGKLPGGLWVRFVFGPFSSVGEAPKGLPTGPLTWYTDHAYHLEDVAAVPA